MSRKEDLFLLYGSFKKLLTMSDSIDIYTDSMNKLYLGILQYLNLQDTDMNKFAFAQSGFLINVNLFNDHQPIVNHEIFSIGNAIPDNNLTYIPNGDFITSYSLLLNHLVPSELSTFNQESYLQASLAKAASEKAIEVMIDNASDKIANQSLQNNLNQISNFRSPLNRLHQNLKQSEQTVYSLLPSQRSLNTAHIPTLSEAMAEVSFLTGARKIDGLNKYNMEVNSDPPKPIGSYAPNFKMDMPPDLFTKWQSNVINDVLACEINVTSQDPLIIIDNYSSTIQSLSTNKEGPQTHMGTYHIDAKFSGLKQIKLYPINWFHPEFFIHDGYELMSSAPTYFGANGILENIPTSLIIAYNVQMKIAFTPEGFNSFNNALDNAINIKSQALSLGPIKIIPHGDLKNFNITKHIETNTISLEPQDVKATSLVGIYSRRVSNYIVNPNAGWTNLISTQL